MCFAVVLVKKNEEKQKDPSGTWPKPFQKGPLRFAKTRRSSSVRYLLGSVEFHAELVRVDLETARRLQVRGCPRVDCGGRLNRADFPRKVRGLAVDDTSLFACRIGLCCGRCRRRVLPPTVRFFGRSSYAFIAGLVAVATTLAGGIAPGARLVGAAWSTVARWIRFLQCELACRGEWQAVRGRLPAVLPLERLPLSLVEVFGCVESDDAWLSALRWLSPNTTTPLFAPRMPRAG